MNKGDELEEYVHYVYSSLLNMKDEGVMVSKKTTLFTRDGISHEIDVYYEFERAGIRHRVAIECKNTERPVEKGRVQEFESKVRDLKNVVGVIISKNGYQESAKKFAEAHGILPLLAADLPTLRDLMVQRLKTLWMPDEKCFGEPFWTIMEMVDGELTGSFCGKLVPNFDKPFVPLFFSKRQAELALEGQRDSKWVVRGIPQYSLRALLMWMQFWKWDMRLCIRFPGDTNRSKFGVFQISMDELRSDYYLGDNVPDVQPNPHADNIDFSADGPTMRDFLRVLATANKAEVNAGSQSK